MKRRSKRIGTIRKVLARNVVELMKQRYRDNPNRPLALAKDARLALSSVQRTIGAKTGASVDTLEALARVFRAQPFELLIPRRPPGGKGS